MKRAQDFSCAPSVRAIPMPVFNLPSSNCRTIVLSECSGCTDKYTKHRKHYPTDCFRNTADRRPSDVNPNTEQGYSKNEHENS